MGMGMANGVSAPQQLPPAAPPAGRTDPLRPRRQPPAGLGLAALAQQAQFGNRMGQPPLYQDFAARIGGQQGMMGRGQGKGQGMAPPQQPPMQGKAQGMQPPFQQQMPPMQGKGQGMGPQQGLFQQSAGAPIPAALSQFLDQQRLGTGGSITTTTQPQNQTQSMGPM